MKAATPQPGTTAARGRTGAAHLQRRTPAAPRCTAQHGRQMHGKTAASYAEEEAEADSCDDPREASVPRVLLVDQDVDAAEALSALLMPEAHVIHAASLAEARHLLRRDIFALVIIDPALPDGDGGSLMPLIVATPVIVHAQREPQWPEPIAAYLPKPWTSQRRLWSTISRLLGVPTHLCAGD